MRVLVTSLVYYPDRPSGSSRLAYDEAVFLAGLGHEVWLVAPREQGSRASCTLNDGLHVLGYSVPKLPLFDPRRMFMHQRRIRTLLSRHLTSKPDVVHGHSLLQYAGVVDYVQGGIRCGYSVHSPVLYEMAALARHGRPLNRVSLWLTGRIASKVEYRCLQRSDFVTSDSAYTKSLLRQIYGGATAERVQVIPGWVDLERFRIADDRTRLKAVLGWPEDVPAFFTLRRLVPRMGLDSLLYALREVKSAGCSFVTIIGGQGPLRNELQKLIDDLGLKGLVYLVGHIPDSQLPAYYAAADAFLLPTAELECFGLIVLEALACGRPVLSTPVGAIPEILARIEPKWLARDQTPPAIADLIIEYLAGRLPRHAPEQLRHTVERLYAQPKILERLVSLALGAS